MNPAFSVILLTTAPGAGYGLLAWLDERIACGIHCGALRHQDFGRIVNPKHELGLGA